MWRQLLLLYCFSAFAFGAENSPLKTEQQEMMAHKHKAEDLTDYVEFLRKIESELNGLRSRLKRQLHSEQAANTLKQLDRLELQVKKVINEMDVKYMLACKVRRAIKKGHKQLNFVKMKYRRKIKK